ncbi:MAG: hypothetical protein JWN78_3202 [Bacteroidota bacterium]|nr:hypothetical protein [Bacteroidota bacterium]
MKGIFCLEGFWYGDHRDPTSVLPILELINRCHKVPFLHHRCATKEEVLYSLERWKMKSFNNKYPILYLAFHGEKYEIKIGAYHFTLDELADVLEDKCEGVIIHFGSCLTLKVSKNKLQSFMERTKALCVMGYKMEVDFIESTSLDLLLFHNIIVEEIKLNRTGIFKIYRNMMTGSKKQMDKLKFTMQINERTRFNRKKVKG